MFSRKYKLFTLYQHIKQVRNLSFFYKGQPDKFCTERNIQLLNTLEGNDKSLILSQALIYYMSSISDIEGNLKKFDDIKQYHDFLIQNLQNIRNKIGPDRQLITQVSDLSY